MPIKVLTVFGTRPEAIKLAPVVGHLEADPRFDSRVCVTGQHRELLDGPMRFFGLRAEYDLGLMRPGQTLFDVAGLAMLGLAKVLSESQPDVVLVQGDTTTTMVASLAAFYAQTPVAHVEAGLRSGDKYRPFPEEMNRRLTTQLASLHFAPTKEARDNLLREGIEASRIAVTGNTVIDALLAVRERQRVASVRERLFEQLRSKGVELRHSNRTVVVTAHRRESFGDDLLQICSAIAELALVHPNVQFVFPLHPNPHVLQAAHDKLEHLSNVQLIRHLDYEEFVFLMTECYFLLSDSGGVQEEAPALGKPVLLMRNNTERPEGVRSGAVKVVGVSTRRIVQEADVLLTDPNAYERMSTCRSPYGDGDASTRIVQLLAQKFLRKAA